MTLDDQIPIQAVGRYIKIMAYASLEPIVAVIVYLIMINSRLGTNFVKLNQVQGIISPLLFSLFVGGFIYSAIKLYKYTDSQILLYLAIIMIPALIASDVFYYLSNKIFVESLAANSYNGIQLARFNLVTIFNVLFFNICIAIILLIIYSSSEFRELPHASSLKIVAVLFLVLGGINAFTNLILVLNVASVALISFLTILLGLLDILFAVISYLFLLTFGNDLMNASTYTYDQLPAKNEFYQGF